MNAAILNQMILLFSLIALGYFLGRIRILPPIANQLFTGFLLKVTLPATILASAMKQNSLQRQEVLLLAAVAVAIFILLPPVSFLLAKLFRMKSPVYQLMMTYSNLGFMGIPIISSVFGEAYTFYAAVFMMVYNIFIFSAGIVVLQGKPAGLRPLLKKLCSPAILASLLAFFLVLFPLPYPTALVDTLSCLGAITTPLAMVLIGAQVTQVRIRDCLKNYKLYILCAIKLLLLPAATYACLAPLFGADSLIAKIAAIEIGLPVGSTITMLCTEYGGDTTLAAEGTCISTILSLGTIPLMLWVLAG